MIFVIGEYIIDLVENNDKYDIKLSGYGLNCAKACMDFEASSAFISAISNDVNGLKVINYLVENEILFDPDLCNNKFKSPLCFTTKDENNKIKKDFYLKNTASMVLNSEELLNSLSNHSDIKAIHIGSLSMLINPTSSSILDVLSFITPRANIYVEPDIIISEIEKIPNWKKRVFDFFEIAKIIKLNKNDISYIFNEQSYSQIVKEIRNINEDAHIIIREDHKVTWISDKDDMFEYDNCWFSESINDCGAIFSGALLAYLSNNGVFGDNGESPKFRINDSIINNALDFACNKVKSI